MTKKKHKNCSFYGGEQWKNKRRKIKEEKEKQAIPYADAYIKKLGLNV